ncbi:MAG TPA: outer membrane beta-barrel protein [Candidatus Mcinerneyibacterium sp.]|nr:outer membrane beta-barrel protein [Candidatus Mcinerneyibacterium sp.]
MKRVIVIFIFVFLFCTFAHAELSFQGWAVKSGYNFDSEDLSLGVDLNLNTIAKNVYFVPQGELDFFGDLKKFGVAASFQYFIPVENMTPYIGAGVDIIHWNYDNDFAEGSETDFKLHVLTGFDFSISENFDVFVELKSRFIDESDTTLWFGVAF